jgi:sortase (surface protein transpeptidase)
VQDDQENDIRSLFMIRRLATYLTLACAGAGLVWLWVAVINPHYYIRVTPQVEVSIGRRTVATEKSPTSEQKQQYVVAADAPRYLKIDPIGVDARVLPVGKDAAGKIGAPTGIWDVGWYSSSSRPGEPGVSFIDGHISGPALPAVFRDLHTLRIDDTIVVERGDGAQMRYRVKSVRIDRLAAIDMNTLLATPVDSKPTLVLMTCGGEFDSQAYTYDQRVVVISTLL